MVRASGRDPRVLAVDIDSVTVAAASRHTADDGAVRVLRADALRLPFRDGSFDFVTCSMFLHHFGPEDISRLLLSFRTIARRAVVVNDLRRHLVPWAFIGVAARLTRRHPMFVHDAPLSVLRGFTPDELRDAAARAGDPAPSVLRRWPFRIVLVLRGGARPE
jgi:SAM-dependent methyltransferase